METHEFDPLCLTCQYNRAHEIEGTKEGEHDVYDYSEGAKQTATLLVKANVSKYGHAPAGARVKVARAELGNHATMSSLQTESQRDEAQRQKMLKIAEAERPKRSSVQAVIEAGLTRITEQAKLAAKRAAEEAAEKAAEQAAAAREAGA